LPYVEVPNPDTLPAQPYGVLLFVGLALGVLTAVWLGRRRGLSGTALGVLLPCALAAALVGGHGFDVAWYFPDADAARWLRFFDGQSLVGALLAAAVTLGLAELLVLLVLVPIAFAVERRWRVRPGWSPSSSRWPTRSSGSASTSCGYRRASRPAVASPVDSGAWWCCSRRRSSGSRACDGARAPPAEAQRRGSPGFASVT